ncbi:hypothetical protein EV193_105439 [Herbihabitans rhizosphaerae]|uniref:DUF3137 domain-containing protein n=1 Tax=Herbihabitans rhizosphaerae TaxID=1872711 RepID=A0A4Q7KMH2_9PSEU|nr:DUF3137 domain-containing protein [Herbihabitans rhizosphaerae]RZS37879.1 hypothetical protein EV193_105439 [Herbihabitans rhizosphaerae]
MGLLDGVFGKKPEKVAHHDGPLAQWSDQYGWEYMFRNDEWADRFPGIPGYRSRVGNEAWHAMRGGHRWKKVESFHYFHRYTEREERYHDHDFDFDADSRSVHHELRIDRYMVVNILLPQEFPVLTVSKEGWMGDSLLDLNMDSPTFDKTFKVKAKKRDSEFARSVLTDEVMGFLLEDQRAMEYDWPFRFEGNNLYTWHPRPDHMDVMEILGTADYLIDIIERIPEHVWGGHLFPGGQHEQ